ncbi:hypothetical protein C8250_029040 [Streptomyces sp. So13.3]|uniref:hypothetical protein n=1 Tax=Streptomyces sp. So13.3 TaxID=2136173 RepID=UPI001105DC00|nr:hypothetical protein [Streptomyces sp. So13.3]QNA75397.1 hypothetical protein C8250_029040 [Streptomyces sp. So13.3]
MRSEITRLLSAMPETERKEMRDLRPVKLVERLDKVLPKDETVLGLASATRPGGSALGTKIGIIAFTADRFIFGSLEPGGSDPSWTLQKWVEVLDVQGKRPILGNYELSVTVDGQACKYWLGGKKGPSKDLAEKMKSGMVERAEKGQFGR